VLKDNSGWGHPDDPVFALFTLELRNY
jgi:hypothetical protein